jgi:hypothetical protein
MLHSPVLRKIPWEKFYVKDTTKGPVVWETKAARFYLNRDDGLPSRWHWLIIARNIENPEEVKYFVSNATQGTPLEVLLHVGFSRWHVERCFEDEKNELGLSHFEVRNYKSLRRHLIITAVSHLFLAKVHQLWWVEKSPVDGMPDSHSFFGVGSVFMADGKSKRNIFGTNSRYNYRNAKAYSQVSPLPHSRETQAIA